MTAPSEFNPILDDDLPTQVLSDGSPSTDLPNVSPMDQALTNEALTDGALIDQINQTAQASANLADGNPTDGDWVNSDPDNGDRMDDHLVDGDQLSKPDSDVLPVANRLTNEDRINERENADLVNHDLAIAEDEPTANKPTADKPTNEALVKSNFSNNKLTSDDHPFDDEQTDNEPDDDLPDDVEMSLFDHLEELRQRIFYGLIAVAVGAVVCFAFVKQIVRLLEVPAQGVKFLQLAPGEYFFVSLKAAAYSGILVASPVILYQIIAFVLPGLTRRERRLLGPIVFGSSFLFVAGLAFAYIALIPAALNFFITYGADVVEQSWSIEKYFDFVLLLMFSTGLAFQVPIIQALLGLLGIVSSQQMIGGWKFVLLGAAIVGAVITPSTDPLTQSLLGGAIVMLYFGGIGLVKLLGK
jgi:sec-independent protein translocase protein TatC